MSLLLRLELYFSYVSHNMAKVVVAFIYMVAILVIGFVSAKRVKTAEHFADFYSPDFLRQYQ